MKKAILLATATLVLAACDGKEDNLLTSSEALQITATIGECVVSRADGAEDEQIPGDHDKWAAGDRIGIISTIGDKARPYVNLLYTTEKGDGNFSGYPIHFYKPMTLTAYYPFTGSEGTLPGENGVISVSTDANAQKNLLNIDFLWDSKKGKGVDKDQVDFSVSNPNVDFVFSHKMSKVTFAFQDSPEIKDEKGVTLAGPVKVQDMINYTIEGLVLDGTFDTSTGVCAVKEVSTKNLAIGVKGTVTHDTPVSPLILFPQTLSGGKAVLHITTDELKDEKPETYQHYKCNLSFSNGEILPGRHYKYTIKVSKLGLIVGEMTVEPWKEDIRSVTATIDGDVFKKND